MCTTFSLIQNIFKSACSIDFFFSQFPPHIVEFCDDAAQIIVLIGLNVFSLLFGFSALLANSLTSTKPTAFKANPQVNTAPTRAVWFPTDLKEGADVFSLPVHPNYTRDASSALVRTLQRAAPSHSALCVSWPPSTFSSCPGKASAATAVPRPTAGCQR